jgi:hypothetical protein
MKRTALSLLAIPVALCAQTTINGGRIIKGEFDASGSTRTLPQRAGTGSPVGRDNCEAPGETYFQTDATPGQNLWACTAAGTPGTWNEIAGGSGGSSFAPASTTVTYSATPTFGVTASIQEFNMTLSGNVTASTLSSAAAGDILIFNVCQNATGGYTFVWPTGFSAASAISSTASTCTTEIFTWNGSSATLVAANSNNTPLLNANQSFSGTDTFTGTVNASGAAHTLPAKVGLSTALPSTCTQGEMYFATNATAGQNWYYCTATNTWTAQVAGGSGGSGLTSVGLTMPSAFTVTGSPLTANGTLAVTGAGTSSQYVTGAGALATFPTISQISGTATASQIPAALTSTTSVNGTTIPASSTLLTTTSGQAVNAAEIAGIAVSGAPSSGQVLTATSSTAANWQTPSSGGGTASLTDTALGTVTSTVTFMRSSNIQEWSLTLGANITSALSGAVAGDQYTFDVCQNASAAYTFAWPTSGFSQAPAITSDLGVCTHITGVWDGSNFQPSAPAATTETPFLLSGAAERAAPTTAPASLYAELWPDSTRHTWTSMDNNSTNKHIMPRTAGSTNDQLASTDLSDSATVARSNGTYTVGDCVNVQSTSGGLITIGDAGAACGTSGGGGSVASVFGRTGAVVANTGDYSFSQISGTAAASQLPAALSSSTSVNGTNIPASSTLLTTASGEAVNSAAIAGITVTGTPSANQVLTAISSTAASWAAPTGGSGGGTVTYTGSHTLGTADNGLLVQMNCSAACTVTLPNPQPSSTFSAKIVSINTTNIPTIALGSSITFNGSTSVPALNAYKPLSVQADSVTSTNYAGDAPLVAGTNVTLTPASNGLTVTASATSSTAFSSLTSSTNTTAAMVVGSGASLAASGGGTISASTATQLAATPSQCSGGQFATGVAASGNANCSASASSLTQNLGSTNPSTCTIGQLFFNTSSTPTTYLCTSTNMWTQVGGSGGSSTITENLWVPFAGQYSNANGATSGSGITNNTTDNTTNTTPTLIRSTAYGYPAYNFDYDTTAETIYYTTMLHQNWTGSINVQLVGVSGSTAGTAYFSVAVACATSGTGLEPLTFNASSGGSVTYSGTAGQLSATLTLSGLTTTGCSAGDTIVFAIARNGTHSGDSLTGTVANLLGMTIQWQHT